MIASAGTEKIFEGASVELIGLTGEGLRSADPDLCKDTAEALAPYAEVLRSGQNHICMLKGHRFGIAEVSEAEYLKEPGIIDSCMTELKEAGCEKLIMLISWTEKHESAHSIVQEAMAHRSVRAGADLVVGNCPGVVQGFDMIEDVPVVYSTGDLLNGSTSGKPKNQQGILVRAVFSFNEADDVPRITVIPIMPYGRSKDKQNDYCPSEVLTDDQMRNAVRNVWQDSTDAALELIGFRIGNQS